MASNAINVTVDASQVTIGLFDAEIALADARVKAAVAARDSLRRRRQELKQDASGIPTISGVGA